MNERSVSLEVPEVVWAALVRDVEVRVLERLAESGVAGPEWLSVETAASYLDVSPERVRKLIARRAIPYYQDGPGCRVFLRRRELDEYMNSFRVTPRRGSHDSRTSARRT